MDRLIDETDPDLLVLSAGARPRLAPIHEHSWESFSAPWNTDLKIAFQVGKTALRRPLRPGSLVIIISSGAALVGSPMSGGYAGAKRMQMFLAGDLQRSSDAAKLGIRFLTLVPKQVLAQSELGDAVAAAYAKLGGITPEKFMQRFGKPLTPQDVGRMIVDIAQGEIRPEGSVLGVSGNGIEAL
jgi:NAD(P)-dependent dehydrogenase (short-subunit alcohol dehydrogenase family)